jgi:hypothetical protein
MSQTSILVQLDAEVEARLAALADDAGSLSPTWPEVISMYFAPDSWEHNIFAPVWLSWKRAKASRMSA